MQKSFDVIIVGAGLVGNSLALMLAQCGFKIALIEAKIPATADDNRSLVLTHSSYQILNGLGVWSTLVPQAYPIKKIQVSQLGHFGTARFEASEFKMLNFGFIVPGGVLTAALQEAVKKPEITFICPAEVIGIKHEMDLTKLEIKTAEKIEIITAPLVVAADGTPSKIRTLENIATKNYDYQQTAIIAQVGLAQVHEFTAYERLTPTGPLALLPRESQQCGLVWTVTNTEVKKILALSEQEFLMQLQQRFGYRLGKFIAVSERRCYPLQLMHAEEQIRSGLVLLGNAAHTLHPIAGQGFNLGLRDAAALAEVLAAARKENKNLGDINVLKHYQAWREPDQQNIIRFTDNTVRLFSHQLLMNFSSLGLFAINSLPLLKRRLLKKLMGVSGKTPALVVGVPQ